MKIFDSPNIRYIVIGYILLFAGFDGAQHFLVPLLELDGSATRGLNALLCLYSSYFLGSIIAPYCTARFGTRTSLLLGALPHALFPLTLPFANTFFIYVLGSAVGFGAGLFWIASGQIVNMSSPEGRVGVNSGHQYSGLWIGSMAGMALGGFLLSYWSAVNVYYLFTVIALLGFALLMKINVAASVTEGAILNVSYLFKSKFLFLFPVIFANYFLMVLSFSALALRVQEISTTQAVINIAIVAFAVKFGSLLGSSYLGGRTEKIDGAWLMLKHIIPLSILGLLMITYGDQLFGLKSDLYTKFLLPLGSILLGYTTSGLFPAAKSALRLRSTDEEYNYQSVGAFHVYATIGIVSSLVMSRFFSPLLVIKAGIILLAIAVPFLCVFMKFQSPTVEENCSDSFKLTAA